MDVVFLYKRFARAVDSSHVFARWYTLSAQWHLDANSLTAVL